jgi:hypothetical protein
VEQLKLQSLASTESVTTYAAWRHIPTTYLICENDEALIPAAQRFMIERAKEWGAASRLRVVELVTRHFWCCRRRSWRLSIERQAKVDRGRRSI